MNTTARFLFPGLLCSILLDAKQNKRLSIATAAFFVGFVFLCIRVYYMATGLCALLFLIIWCVGRKIISKRTRLFTALVLLAFLAFELAVVVFRSKAVADFIVTLFHKSPGFTGRDALWASSINYIRKNPIIGYGVLDEATLLKMIRSPSGGHNYFLDLLFQRGIVGFIPAFIFLIFPLFRKEQNQYNSTRYILTGFALAYILICALVILNVEPESFENFYDAVYWACVSLTTMGYGDIYPVTAVGRFFTMISSFLGIAIVALPAGIITAGYMAEVEHTDSDTQA